MQFTRVCLESLGYSLPTEVVSSEQLELRLEPLYSRLRLPRGRLELMTGIAHRRVWPKGSMPSDQSIASAGRALAAAGISGDRIGALVHASVCRDHLEPATACRVHHELRLPDDCLIYDLSNACLGLLNGALQMANMIELGQIQAGLVVGTEDCRPLMESTIASLNEDPSWTRQSVKAAVASLTIGSGSCAMLLVDQSLTSTGNRLLSGTARCNTQFHRLCHSGRDEAMGDGMKPLMQTDSERLMREGIATGAATFEAFLRETGWDREQIDRVFTHQVGATHRRLMLEALRLDPKLDFGTVDWLGNTGSVALPLTMAIGCQLGLVRRGDQLALLGIGSGINSVMLGVQWQETRVASADGTQLPDNVLTCAKSMA